MTSSSSSITSSITSDHQKHSVEDTDSWANFQSRNQGQQPHESSSTIISHRQLRDKRSSSSYAQQQQKQLTKLQQAASEVELQKELQFQQVAQVKQQTQAQLRIEAMKAHEQTLRELWANPGIMKETVHGLMIDAGSTGSRLHVFEWAPRILQTWEDIQEAVSGSKLSFPGTDARWTDRLRPGLASFASIQDDDELRHAMAEYLQPLLDFARTVLHAKQEVFADFPIFLRATAGLRMLNSSDRARVLTAVRELFHNKTYCPFQFDDEQARVLSGEEEAIYDWAGVNFLLGDLLQQSEGAGTVINPKQTHGALDLGGASTQISFYEPTEDIMSNLFKLQIGQAKHWNVYAHSFLFYGMNEAIDRFQARLAAGKSTQERLLEGIYNPCLPGGGTSVEIRTNIHVNPENGGETWSYNETYPSGDGYYQAILKNDQASGDFEACMALTKDLLHLEKNSWCEFAHFRDLAGAYQPPLPTEHSESFGEFVAFSNYYHIWKFLELPERANLTQLYDATRQVCSMSRTELNDFNYHGRELTPEQEEAGEEMKGKVSDDDLDSYCFRSIYAFQLLHNGYGFRMDDTIRVTKVINGHKVGWALGAMLYEINTMPWKYLEPQPGQPSSSSFSVSGSSSHGGAGPALHDLFLGTVAMGMIAMIVMVLRWHNHRVRNLRLYEYEPLKEVQ